METPTSIAAKKALMDYKRAVEADAEFVERATRAYQRRIAYMNEYNRKVREAKIEAMLAAGETPRGRGRPRIFTPEERVERDRKHHREYEERVRAKKMEEALAVGETPRRRGRPRHTDGFITALPKHIPSSETNQV